MALQSREDPLKEIRKAVQENKLLIGTLETMKQLKLGKVKKVFLTANAPKAVMDDVAYYGSLAKTPFVVLKETNEDLGVVCKKPYAVSVAAIKV